MSNPSQPQVEELVFADSSALIDTSMTDQVSHYLPAVFLKKRSINLEQDEVLPYM